MTNHKMTWTIKLKVTYDKGVDYPEVECDIPAILDASGAFKNVEIIGVAE